MNTEIATAAAWRPTDLAVQLGRIADQAKREDLVLAEYDARLTEIRDRFRHDRYPGFNPEDPLGKVRARLRHRAAARQMWIAHARVVAQLIRLEAEAKEAGRCAS